MHFPLNVKISILPEKFTFCLPRQESPAPGRLKKDCGKSRQTAATAGIDYYRFTTVRRTESII